MSRRTHLIAILFVLVVIAGAGYSCLPQMWAKAVPGYLQENVGSFLVIEKSEFLRSPPRLLLSGIHLKNEAEFGDQDAIRVGHIDVEFLDTKRNPMRIKSVTASDVKGRLVIKGQNDNFSTLFGQLMQKKDQPAKGEMANKAILQNVYIKQASLQNEDGSTVMPLENTEYTPTGVLVSGNANVQQVVTNVLAAIVKQQADAGPSLVIKGAASSVMQKLKETGKAIGDYFSK